MSPRLLISGVSLAVLASAGLYYASTRDIAAPAYAEAAPAKTEAAPAADAPKVVDVQAESKKISDLLAGDKKAASTLTAPADQVVATVGGENITRKDVDDLYALLKQRSGPSVPPEEQIFWPLVDQIVSSRLVIQAATAEKLDATPEFQKSINMAREQIIQEAYVEKVLAGVEDDAKLKPMYDKMVATQKDEQEVKAAHILVDDEAKAKELIAKLEKGADFAQLAKENSKDPGSKDNGGDLGFFSKDAMVPEFANAAFAMQKGEVSKVPVKSMFGYHIIKLEDKRARQAPTYEEAKPQLVNQLRQETLQKALLDLKSTAKVEMKTGAGLPPMEPLPTVAPATDAAPAQAPAPAAAPAAGK